MLMSKAATIAVHSESCLMGGANEVCPGQAETGVRGVASGLYEAVRSRRWVCSTYRGILLSRQPPRHAPGAMIPQTYAPFGRCY